MTEKKEELNWIKVAKNTAKISLLFSMGMNAGYIAKKLNVHPVTVRRYRQQIKKAYLELKEEK